MATSEELRREAEAMDNLSRTVSYAPDKRWAAEKAAALRRQADRQDQLDRRSPPQRH